MPQNYKVGDKVRILDASKIISPGVALKNGDIFEITGTVGLPDMYQSKRVPDGKYLGINPGESKYIEKVAEDVTKFKVGDKVRIINAGGSGHTNGDTGVIESITGPFYDVDVKGYTQGHYAQDIEKVSDKPTKKQRLTDAERSITSLESEVAELKAKVEALEKAQKPTLHIGKATVHITQETPKLSANEQRKAIIAEAKAFVEDVTNRNHPDLVSQGLTIGAWFVSRGAAVQTIKAEFIINADKRTVVALIRDIRGNRKNKVRAKAIAKCAPDDVFNADIGKAIALGRALGLDVKRFEQAVKPTEVVVGHRVHKFRSVCHIADGTVVSVGDTSYVQGNEGCKFTSGDKSEWSFKDWVTITDDSEAQY